MEGLLATGLLILAVLYAALLRVMNRWIACQCAHLRDDKLPPTPALIRTWKKEIKKHEYGSATFRSYDKQLADAGLPNYGNRYKS